MAEVTYELNSVDITDRVEAGDVSLEEAATEGTVGTGQIVVRDPAADLEPKYNQTFVVKEAGTVVWRGFVGPDERGRDPQVEHYGPRRYYTLTILDQNHLFDERRAEDFSRASNETDVARVQAAFAEFRSTVDRTTYVPNSATVAMDEADYTDRMLRDVIADCAEAADKDYWIDRDTKLHYAVEGSLTSNQATFSLTDDVTAYAKDIMASTIPTVYNIGLIRRTSDPNAFPMQNSVLLKYGDTTPPESVTVTDATSIADHGTVEGAPIYDQRATTEANATLRAQAFLRRAKQPEVSYQTVIALPTLRILKAGQFVPCTSDHQGLSSTLLQIVRWRARRIGTNAKGYWEVELELASPLRLSRRTSGFRDLEPTDTPPFVCVPNDFSVLWDTDPIEGACIIAADEESCSSTNTVELSPGSTYRVEYLVFRGQSPNGLHARLDNHAGTVAGDHDYAFGAGHAEETFTLGGGVSVTDFHASLLHVTTSGFNPTGSSVSARVFYISGSDPRFVELGICTTRPSANQQVLNELLTGLDNDQTYNTNFAYVPGSLVIDFPPGVVADETDPDSGEFTLPIDLQGTTIRVSYLAQGGDELLTGAGANSYGSNLATLIPPAMLGTGSDGSGDHILLDNNTWVDPSVVVAGGHTHDMTVDRADGLFVSVRDPLDVTLVQMEQSPTSISFDNPTPGNLLTLQVYRRASNGTTCPTPTGWTAGPDGTAHDQVGVGDSLATFYKIATGSETSVSFSGHAVFCEWAGVTTLGAHNEVQTTAANPVRSGSVTPTADYVALVLGGLAVRIGDGSGVHIAPASGWTELFDFAVDGGVGHPLSWSAYQVIHGASGSYNPEGTISGETSAQMAGQTIVFEDEFPSSLSSNVTDQNDGTYAPSASTFVLSIDLESAYHIGYVLLKVGTDDTGTIEYTLEGANEDDFSDAVEVDSASFTALGSFSLQSIEFRWAATDSYRYWRITSDEPGERRLYTLEMYDTDLVDHGFLRGLADDDHPQYVRVDTFDAKGDLLVGSGSDAYDNLSAGSNGQVLTADSTAPLGLKWSSVAGAGGSAIYSTQYASPPASPASGDIWLPTDSYYDYLRYNGSVWVPYLSGVGGKLPDDTGFGWVNQGSSTLTTSAGAFVMKAVAGEGSFHIRSKTAPATPYTVTAAFRASLAGNQFPGVVLLHRQSSDGKLRNVGFFMDSGAVLSVDNFTNPTTFSSRPVNAGAGMVNQVGVFWLRLSDDGTNVKYYFSHDGRNFIQLYSVGRTTFLTPDQIGWAVKSHSGSSFDSYGTLLSWEVT